MKRTRLRLLPALLASVISVTAFSCAKDDVTKTETEQTKTYDQKQVSISALAFSEPFDVSSTDTEGRAINFSSTSGLKAKPKFKNITSGTKVLCIVRSSNTEQPINYFWVTAKQDANTATKYYITHAEDETVSPKNELHYMDEDQNMMLNYDASKDLGTLYMMVVVGGEWDSTNKRLKFSNKVSKGFTAGGEVELDVPYISEWKELEIEDNTIWKLKPKGYKDGTNTTVAYTLKPQGLLMDARVENEMGEPSRASRSVNLYSFTVRSSAYAGDGYFDFSKTTLDANFNLSATNKNQSLTKWIFTDTSGDGTTLSSLTPSSLSSLKKTTYTLPEALLSTYTSQDTVRYNTARWLYNHTSAPHVLFWAMPTTTALDASNVGTNVATEIFAHVEDVRRTESNSSAPDSRTVYSNDSNVDAEEANGKIVIPSMKSLPVYASMQLADPLSTPKALKNGATYSLTLNLNRQPMNLDLLSQYPVNASGTAFVDGNYNDVGYFLRRNYDGTAAASQVIPMITSTKWKDIDFESFAAIFWRSNFSNSDSTYADTKYDRIKSPNVIPGIGNYSVEDRFNFRAQIAFNWNNGPDNTIIAYALIFYPAASSTKSNATARDHTLATNASHMAVLRYEFSHNTAAGVPVMKMTERFLGSYFLWAGNLKPGIIASQSLMLADARKFMSDESFWKDELYSKDDVVRYLPLLGYQNANGTQTMLSGSMGYMALGAGHGEFSKTRIQHFYRGQGNYAGNQIKIPAWLMRSTLDLTTR